MKKQKNKNFRIPFLAGLGLLFLGIVGVFVQLHKNSNLDSAKIFPAKTHFFAEITINKHSLKNLSNIFKETDFIQLIDDSLAQKFNFSFSEDMTPWIGQKASIGILDDGEFIIALKYRDKRKTKKFLDNFKTPNETFVVQKTKNGEIWTPGFSSPISFGFTRGWLLISMNEKNLQRVLNEPSDLAHNTQFVALFKDLPNNSFLRCYTNIEQIQHVITQSEKLAQYKPLFEAFASTMPGVGMTARINNENLVFESKFKTHTGVFSTHEIQKQPNKTIPELAKYSPKDVLFFINGTDLYAKYVHTKNFLSELNPQFPIIFDGLLRAQSREIFGEEFDFESDFLSKMRGQYALLVDYEDALYPFLDFTFLTGFGGMDRDESLSQFHEAIHFAQTRFAPKTETVELPDGSTREELVSAKPEEIPIRKIEYENRSYFTAQNPISNKKFSYGFVDNHFVFSTHEEGLKSVIATTEKKQSNLAENADFRDSVLFNFSPSESYGFINTTKLVSGIEILKEVKSENVWSQFWKSNIRNITFARKVFPEEVFLKAILFAR